MTIGTDRRSGVAVLDLSSSTGSTIEKTERKNAKVLASSSSSLARVSDNAITLRGDPEEVKHDFSNSQQRLNRKRVGIFRIIRRGSGRARSKRANDSSSLSSCSCPPHNGFSSKHDSKLKVRIPVFARGSRPSGDTVVRNATATGKMFSENSSAADGASTNATTMSAVTTYAAAQQGAPNNVDNDEYCSAAAFLAAFHSRTVAMVRATELDAIDEGTNADDMSVDENQQSECRCSGEGSRYPMPSLCMRKDGSLTRRSKTSCCLMSLAADDSVPDLAEEEQRAQHEIAREGYSGTRSTESGNSRDARYDTEAWGWGLDSEADTERQQPFALPSSVQHYGMVGGMRTSASLHHSRIVRHTYRDLLDRQMTM